VSDQVIPYAPGELTPVHSRSGVAGFVCGTLAAIGIVVTMILLARPIPGPLGGWIRGFGVLFGIGVLSLWIMAVALSIRGVREPSRRRGFARAALAMCAGTVLLFVSMILWMY
jgi:hypothetical protein